jgi:hypothetical protein
MPTVTSSLRGFRGGQRNNAESFHTVITEVGLGYCASFFEKAVPERKNGKEK